MRTRGSVRGRLGRGLSGQALSALGLKIFAGWTGPSGWISFWLPSQARGHERCRAQAKSERQAGPERCIGARVISRQGSQPDCARTRPCHPRCHIRGWIPAGKAPGAQRGVRSAKAGACLGHGHTPRALDGTSSSAAPARSGITTPARPDSISAALLTRPVLTRVSTPFENWIWPVFRALARIL